MRSLLAAAAVLILGMSAALAEKRVFIIANNSDGYGIDRCLANGSTCGNAAANAYCKSREFAQAVTFQKVDRGEITGAVPTTTPACRGATCEEFVAITCSR